MIEQSLRPSKHSLGHAGGRLRRGNDPRRGPATCKHVCRPSILQSSRCRCRSLSDSSSAGRRMSSYCWFVFTPITGSRCRRLCWWASCWRWVTAPSIRSSISSFPRVPFVSRSFRCTSARSLAAFSADAVVAQNRIIVATIGSLLHDRRNSNRCAGRVAWSTPIEVDASVSRNVMLEA